MPPRPRTPRDWLLWTLACALALAVCVFAVIGVASIFAGQHATRTTQPSGGLIEQPASAPLELAVSPRALTNCHTVAFKGRIPPHDVPVVLEARFPGAPWRQFAVVYTRRDGSFTAHYRFTRTTTKTRYAFRVVVPSVPTSVLVRPRRADSVRPRPECPRKRSGPRK